MSERGLLENTRAAFTSAQTLGADVFETDTQLTRDGVPVLFHDADLRRVLGDERRVDQVDLVELRSMLRRRGGLLTLEEALTDFPDARFNIDIKSLAVARPAGAVIGRFWDRCLVAGFDDRARRLAIAVAREQMPSATTALPATSPGEAGVMRAVLAAKLPRLARRARCQAFAHITALQIPERHGRIPVLSRGLVRAAHEHGVEVHVWTVNEPETMRRLVDLGVDGIVTDRLDIAIDTFRPNA